VGATAESASFVLKQTMMNYHQEVTRFMHYQPNLILENLCLQIETKGRHLSMLSKSLNASLHYST
jgi:hypothetical protein